MKLLKFLAICLLSTSVTPAFAALDISCVGALQAYTASDRADAVALCKKDEIQGDCIFEYMDARAKGSIFTQADVISSCSGNVRGDCLHRLGMTAKWGLETFYSPYNMSDASVACKGGVRGDCLTALLSNKYTVADAIVACKNGINGDCVTGLINSNYSPADAIAACK